MPGPSAKAVAVGVLGIGGLLPAPADGGVIARRVTWLVT